MANWHGGAAVDDDASSPGSVFESEKQSVFTAVSPLNQLSPSYHKRFCRNSKYGSLFNIMGGGVPAQAESSIHDLDIDNRNKILSGA